jgi:hypothetical protein
MSIPSFWGPSPPAQPFVGMAWLNTVGSTTAPQLFVWDSNVWNLVGTWDTVAGTFAVASGGHGNVAGGGPSPLVSSVASATTTSIGAAGTTPIEVVTGTTTITSFGVPATPGMQRILVFAGTPLITYGANSIILPGGDSITAGLGDVAVMQATPQGSWRLSNYQRASRGVELAPVLTSISAAANNGTGLIRLTVTASTGFVTGTLALVSVVASGNVTSATLYYINVVDSTHIDLLGSTFAATFAGAIQAVP